MQCLIIKAGACAPAFFAALSRTEPQRHKETMNHDTVADGAARLRQSPMLRLLATTTVSMNFFFVALWLCERI